MLQFIRSFLKKKTPARRQALDGKTPAHSLSLAYIAALGVIAVLTIGSHIMTAHITNKQKEGAEIAYKIGRQETLIRQTVLYAGKYFNLNEKLDHDFLVQSVRQLQEARQFLAGTMAQKDLLGRPFSKALHNIYFEKPHTLDQQMTVFIARAQEFAELPEAESRQVRKMILNDISTFADPLTSGLNLALENYQDEAQRKTEGYYAVQFYSAIFVLIVLLLEALLIFRPLVIRVDEYHQMLLRYALEDSLTGLNNRRAFMKRATDELRRTKREETSAVVVLCDLDKFKSVNDTYGHKVGDLVLQHYAAQLQKLLRSGDIIGRIGGEEFALLLPRTSGKTGFQTIDRLREKVSQTPCPYVDEKGEQQTLKYTASFGLVVVGPGQLGNIDDLLALADGGLYEAKNRGRNCVVQVPSGAPVKIAAQS